ncbi:MAG: transporter substrate-binding domain-containing protein [Alphaproteobacteria bacterium]|nr:transporter substrate-binding domain-containing protein [Alphaproteobacteria bacterium]
MKSHRSFWAAFAGGLLVLLGAYLFAPGWRAAQPHAAETAYERVMRTGTLRCGYIIAAPGLIKDAKSGQLSGLVYDLMTAIGTTLNLKIDWAEETTFATELEGLKTRRFDVICSTLYLRPNLMPFAELTQPYFYLPINVIQRKGEERFKTKADIDRPGVKMGAVDGTMPSIIAQEDFKQAAIYSMPQMSAYSENLLAVMTGKADVTFVDPLVYGSFAKNNPGQLEVNTTVPAPRLFANILAVQKGEHDLVTMLSAAIQHLLNNGKVEEIIRAYEPFPGAIFRVATPYAAAKQ